MFDNLEPTFYPLIWFETTLTLDEEMASDVKLLIAIQKAIPGAGWAILALGILLSGFTGWLIYR